MKHIRERLLDMIAAGASQEDLQVELLVDSYRYYSADPNKKCENGTGCRYSPVTVNKVGVSEGCGIGRLLLDEEKLALDNGDIGSVGNYRFIDYLGANSLLIYKSFDLEFLQKIQGLHDGEHFLPELSTTLGWFRHYELTENIINRFEDAIKSN